MLLFCLIGFHYCYFLVGVRAWPTHLCMFGICSSKQPSTRQYSAMLVSACMSSPQSRPKPISCRQCLLGSKSHGWTCITTVPLQIWWLLWNCKTKWAWCHNISYLETFKRLLLPRRDSYCPQTSRNHRRCGNPTNRITRNCTEQSLWVHAGIWAKQRHQYSSWYTNQSHAGLWGSYSQ